MSFLCKLGIHEWHFSKPKGCVGYHEGYDDKTYCWHCGKKGE